MHGMFTGEGPFIIIYTPVIGGDATHLVISS